MAKTLVITDPMFEEHDTGAHPENAGRLEAIRELLNGRNELAACEKSGAEQGSREQVLLVHPSSHIDLVRTTAANGGGSLDADTRVSPKSYQVAMAAAGSACAAVDAVVDGSAANALCLIRPPGHHAVKDRAMGFCLFSNIAIAARHAQQKHKLQRILIVDWDVHHGNGTQDIFYDDPNVNFFSIHRFPFYPGTGDVNETGTGDGLGSTLNIPVEYGTSRKRYFEMFESGLRDAVEKAKPELVLISAGFDAHRDDPVGSLNLETEDFATLTQLVKNAAAAECGGKIVSLLEGGYNPTALAASVQVHLRTLT